MPQTTVALPALRRPRTMLQAHSPLHAHALLQATEALTSQSGRSRITEAIAAALPGGGPVSALDLAATGLPLGAVLAGVNELAEAGALRVSGPLAAGNPAAAKVLADLDTAWADTEVGGPVSVKVAVAGPQAHALVASLGRVHRMEGIVDRVPGRAARPWVFTRLAAGPHVVYVVGDGFAAPGDEEWYQLLRGAVGLVVADDADPESGHRACRVVAEALAAGLPCVLADGTASEQGRTGLGGRVRVAAAGPHDTAASRAALRLLSQAITDHRGGGR